MTYGGQEKHFDELHSPRASSFASHFPVDLSNPTVRSIVKGIPDTFDNIFLSKGSSEQFSTSAKGGTIPLVPYIAEEHRGELSQKERREFDAKQFVCRALTDRKPLSVIHLSYDRSDGFITDFSLVADAGITNGIHDYYELRGSLTDTVFEMSHHTDDSVSEATPLDEKTATDFVKAINLQRADNPYIGTLQGMLDNIKSTSPSVHHEQHGDYSVFDGRELLVTVSREETIEQGIGHLALYLVSISQVGIPDTETNSRTDQIFRLSYDSKRTPPYQADLGSLVDDPDERVDRFKRANQYEAFSSELRNHPEIIFTALDKALSDLAEL